MNQLTVCVSEKYAHFLGKLSCQTEAFTVALPLSGYFIFTENTDSIVFVMMKPSGKHTLRDCFFMYTKTFHTLHSLASPYSNLVLI